MILELFLLLSAPTIEVSNQLSDMTRFASVGRNRAANYTRAGVSVKNEAAKAFDAARSNSPDYGKLAETGMKANSYMKRAAMNAEAQVAKAGVSAVGKVQNQALKADITESKIKTQMAGRLAAVGGILSKGLGGSGRSRPSEPSSVDYQQFIDQAGATADKYTKKAEDIRGGLSTNNKDADVATNPGTSNTGTSNTGSATAFNPDAGAGWDRLGRTIRFAEGTSGDAGYTTMFTHARFSDTSQHPRQLQQSGDLKSDAAGAYQFLSTTWDGAKNALGLKDFSPASQERAGEYLAQQRGVDTSRTYETKEEFAQAIDRLAPEWASLPTAATGTSYYGQGGKTLDQLWEVYNQG